MTNQKVAENTQQIVPRLVDNYIDYRVNFEMHQHDAYLSQFLTPLENEEDINGFRSENPYPLRRELSLNSSTFRRNKPVEFVDLTPEEEDFLFSQLRLTIQTNY
ncbi:hypothetical protein [Empedobacter tilapiae]